MFRHRKYCTTVSRDTFGVGIIDGKRILANVSDSYKTEKGGIVPIEAAKHHEELADSLLRIALEEADTLLEDIDLIAFSQGPGLGPCLRVGHEIAKILAKQYKKPLVGVNHCVAHLEIGKLTGAKDPVLLYTSGANTQVIAFEGGKYRIFGETLDQGVGNFLDAFARYIGIGFPGGPKIEQIAKKGKNYVELPYVVKGMDVSFGGLITNLKQKFDSKKYKIEDLCYSMQETVFAMLMEVAERAMAHCQKQELLLGGGVACNKRLQEMAQVMCKERNAKLFVPENQFLVDNGAMIAWLGQIMYKAGIKENIKESKILPYQRTDDVRVVW